MTTLSPRALRSYLQQQTDSVLKVLNHLLDQATDGDCWGRAAAACQRLAQPVQRSSVLLHSPTLHTVCGTAPDMLAQYDARCSPTLQQEHDAAATTNTQLAQHNTLLIAADCSAHPAHCCNSPALQQEHDAAATQLICCTITNHNITPNFTSSPALQQEHDAAAAQLVR